MKRIVMVACVLAASAWAFTPAMASNAPQGYKSFTSAARHFLIVYPTTWRAKANSTGQQFFYGKVVNGFTTNVNVYTVSGAGKMSISQLLKAIANADRGQGASVSTISRISVAGRAAGLIPGTYQKKVKGRMVKDRFATAAFSARGLAWEITYSAEPTAFDSTYPVFTTMLSSFALTK